MRRTCWALRSTPRPSSVVPQLLEMISRSRTPLRWTAAMRFSGFPHNPKPPTIRVVPSGISATAASALVQTLFMAWSLGTVTRLAAPVPPCAARSGGGPAPGNLLDAEGFLQLLAVLLEVARQEPSDQLVQRHLAERRMEGSSRASGVVD